MRKIVIALVLVVVGITAFAKEVKVSKYLMYHQDRVQHVVDPFPNYGAECTFHIPAPNNKYYKHQQIIYNNGEKRTWTTNMQVNSLKELRKDMEVGGEYIEHGCYKQVVSGLFYDDKVDAAFQYQIVLIRDSNGSPVGFCGTLYVITEPQSNKASEIANNFFETWTPLLMN